MREICENGFRREVSRGKKERMDPREDDRSDLKGIG